MPKRLFIAASPELRVQLQSQWAPETLYVLDDIGQLNLSDCEVVVIDYGTQAKESALGLAARGVSKAILSYVDLTPSTMLASALAKPKHLFWDDVVPLSEMAGQEDFPVYKSGIFGLDRHLNWGWRIPELVVVAGPYGCGKSMVGQILAANFVNTNGAELATGALLCSWEDLGSEVYRNVARFARAEGNPTLLDNVHFVRRASSEDRLVSWFVELISYHKARYGTRFFFLDPWNEMDHVKDSRQHETEYTRDIMKDLRRVVDQEQIILVLATHISAKYIRGDGGIEPFRIGHAFGSSQFGAKADRGLCIVRAKTYATEKCPQGHTIVRHDKSKIERLMGIKGTLAFSLDADKFDLVYDQNVTQSVKELWKG